MEAVVVEVLDEGLADGPPALVDALEAELPEQVLLQGFGPGDRSFDEHPLGVVVGARMRGEAGIGAVLERGGFLALPGFALGKAFQGEGGGVGDDLEGRIRLDLFLDLLL